jgi:hypothetical protein
MKHFIRGLRTNENILIAVESLIGSRSTFMEVFLVTFMMSLTINDSPAGYLIYRLLTCALLGIFSQLLVRWIRRYPLASWRLGILAVCLQIVAIMVFYQYADIYPYILAFFGAIESTLFWRPHCVFGAVEVSNSRRLRFESLKNIWSVAIKITVPVILGLVIVETTFIDAAIIVLVLSVVQLFLTFLFKPTVTLPRKSGCKNVIQAIKKYWGRGYFSKIALAQSRGFFASVCAYVVVPILLIHSLSSSDFDLGLYTSFGSILSIIYLGLYWKSKQRPRLRHALLLLASLSMIIMPLIYIVWPNLTIAVVFYLITIIFAERLFNTLAVTAYINVVRDIKDEDKFEVEAVSEGLLSIGRVITLGGLLAIVLLGGSIQTILIYCAATALVSLLFTSQRIIKL